MKDRKKAAQKFSNPRLRAHLVLTMSTGMEAAVVTRPLIMLAQKWHRILSEK